MNIYGLHFTSHPTRRKQITCAAGSLDNGVLNVELHESFASFPEFDEFLAHPGPWRVGLGCPFGQPRELLTNLGLTGDRSEVVTWLTNRGRGDFVKLLDRYRSGHAKGSAFHSVTIAR